MPEMFDLFFLNLERLPELSDHYNLLIDDLGIPLEPAFWTAARSIASDICFSAASAAARGRLPSIWI